MDKNFSKVTKVVVVGGGTGTYVVLSGLKNYPLQITAVISTLDSGGSTGRLRDQLGVLPPGDLRQALVALSDSEKIWRDLFTYRFEKGDLDGHNFGNIFISALEKISGSFDEAIAAASYILDIKGNVVPVTTDHAELCAELENGHKLKGEKLIDSIEPPSALIKKVYLEPEVSANPRALKEIKQADFIIFGPGDLYTSIIPNLLVSGVGKAVRTSQAKKIYISNLMTKPGHTDGFGVKEHIQLLEEYLGSKIDVVLVNSSRLPKKLTDWYIKTSNSYPVRNNLGAKSPYFVINSSFLSSVVFEQKISDRVQRSVLRHDSSKLAQALFEVFTK